MHFLEALFLGWLLFGLLIAAGLSFMCKRAVETLENRGRSQSTALISAEIVANSGD